MRRRKVPDPARSSPSPPSPRSRPRITFGVTRYRAPAEVALVLAAAIGAAAAVGSRRSRLTRDRHPPAATRRRRRRRRVATAHDRRARTGARSSSASASSLSSRSSCACRGCWSRVATSRSTATTSSTTGRRTRSPTAWASSTRSRGRRSGASTRAPRTRRCTRCTSRWSRGSAARRRSPTGWRRACSARPRSCVVGLVARRIAGDRGRAHRAPCSARCTRMLWINDGMLISESMYVLVIALTLLCAYRLCGTRARGSTRRCSAAPSASRALTRPEAVHARPASSACRSSSPARAGDAQRFSTLLRRSAALCLVVILPWWVRNLTTFENPMFLATGHGERAPERQLRRHVLRASSSATGTSTASPRRPPPPQNEQRSELLQSTSVPGLAYLLAQDPRDESIPDTDGPRRRRSTTSRTTCRACPIVVAARVGRVWGVFRAEPGGELRHLLRAARALAVVGGHVDVLRAVAVRRSTRWW